MIPPIFLLKLLWESCWLYIPYYSESRGLNKLWSLAPLCATQVSGSSGTCNRFGGMNWICQFEIVDRLHSLFPADFSQGPGLCQSTAGFSSLVDRCYRPDYRKNRGLVALVRVESSIHQCNHGRLWWFLTRHEVLNYIKLQTPCRRSLIRLTYNIPWEN